MTEHDVTRRHPRRVDRVDRGAHPIDAPTEPLAPVPAPPDGSREGGSGFALVVPLAVGGAVAVALGVYGRVHEPVPLPLSVPGFSGLAYVKAWLTTLAAVFGVVQLLSALSMAGRLGGWRPAAVATVHRWSGRAAVLASVPVALHCLYAVGFDHDRARVLIHSVAGCLFYGAFVTKMLFLARPGARSWTMPLTGGAVLSLLTLLWLTSALWLFTDQGLRF